MDDWDGTAGAAPGPPFAGCERIAVVVPAAADGLSAADAESLGSMPATLRASRAGLERELGAPIDVVDRDPGGGPRWLIGPAGHNPGLAAVRAPAEAPELFLDRERRLLVTDAPTVAGVWETFSWLRSLARMAGGVFAVADCPTPAAAAERIWTEVGDSYPAFDLRDLDWAGLSERRGQVAGAADPIAAMQEWLAELQDTHTWVRPAQALGQLPYEARLGPERAELIAVAPGSPAWEAGARPGDRLLDIDCAGWWRRTAATPRARPLVAGRRALSGEIGALRELTARSPAGRVSRWRERIPAQPWQQPVAWSALPDQIGYLQLRAWAGGADLESAIDAALGDFTAFERLIVDLRGNGGGNMTLAQRFRDRFLRGPAVLGAIRYSAGHRRLTPPEPLLGEPAEDSRRWPGRVRFLTDALTYSASEDALLGLQGLSHVEVLGTASGGGSGRCRILRLLPGWNLTISTALTYDRQGRCIEGAGIPVDRRIAAAPPGAPDAVLEAARRDW